MTTIKTMSQPNPTVRAGVRRRITQVLGVLVLQGALLFISAGRLDWLWAWVYLAAYVAIISFNALVVLRRNPELIAERGKAGANAKDWDKILAPWASAWMPLIMLVVCGLDERFGWPPPLPIWVNLIGLVAVLLGYALVSWAMSANSFFSGLVRIQSDRGHAVANGGPYAYVRHPGYVGMITYSLATPLLLGSLWGLIPAAVILVLFVLRTSLEDRTLQAELSGYREYAHRVRYRLLPGIW